MSPAHLVTLVAKVHLDVPPDDLSLTPMSSASLLMGLLVGLPNSNQLHCNGVGGKVMEKVGI